MSKSIPSVHVIGPTVRYPVEDLEDIRMTTLVTGSTLLSVRYPLSSRRVKSLIKQLHFLAGFAHVPDSPHAQYPD